MREIDLDISAPKRRVTVMSYGASRAGKTRFAATFPRPLFLSDNSEGGWETIRNMNPDDRYEPDVVPRVWAMEKPEDMVKAVMNIDAMCRGPLKLNGKTYKPGDVRTVVIDSLTFYGDSFLTHLTRTNKDMRLVYQTLNAHLREVMVRVHELPVNVVWICLEKAPDEENPTMGGILIPGQTKDKAPARCDYWFYHRSVQKGPNLEWEVRTKKFGVWPAGGRDEGALPDPLPSASYRVMAEALGLITSEAGAYSAAELAEQRAADEEAEEAAVQTTPPPATATGATRPAPVQVSAAPAHAPGRNANTAPPPSGAQRVTTPGRQVPNR